jgi:light-harvesting complex 1 beta chain
VDISIMATLPRGIRGDYKYRFSEGINMAASLSGLTEEQAQEFHAQFKIGFQTWLAIAIVAHVLTFAWRPWF